MHSRRQRNTAYRHHSTKNIADVLRRLASAESRIPNQSAMASLYHFCDEIYCEICFGFLWPLQDAFQYNGSDKCHLGRWKEKDMDEFDWDGNGIAFRVTYAYGLRNMISANIRTRKDAFHIGEFREVLKHARAEGETLKDYWFDPHGKKRHPSIYAKYAVGVQSIKTVALISLSQYKNVNSVNILFVTFSTLDGLKKYTAWKAKKKINTFKIEENLALWRSEGEESTWNSIAYFIRFLRPKMVMK